MIFYQLYTLGYLDLEQIFCVNLILLIVCRGIYITSYYFHYCKDYNKQLEEGKKLFTRNEIIYFSAKQTSIIIFGMLYFPIAVFISFYSLLVANNYFKQFGEQARLKFTKYIAKLIDILLPLIGIIWFLFIESNYYAIAAIGISLITYFHYGLKNSSLSLGNLIEKYNKRRFNTIPKFAQITILILMIATPTTILSISAAYAPPEKKTYMVTMRDGVELATDVYFSPGSFGAPRPVILIRTPYGKSGMGLYRMLYSTQDYHIVVQDIRGTHESSIEGNFLLFADAYKDGVDTLKWILDRNWCNGKIASAGASALGINQYFYAGMNPDGLLAQSIMVATPDLYKTAIYPGGAFKEYMVNYWIEHAAPDNYEHQIEMIINHPKKDYVYNSTSLFMDLGPSFQKVGCAALHIGGWYDVMQQGTLDGYIGYDDFSLPEAQGKQLLIMGPFTHGFPGEGKQGELYFPTKSVSAFDLYLNWERKLFDYALLGSAFDWTGNRVAYYMMGDVDDASVNANDYRFAKDWPIPYENDTWYLNADGILGNNKLITVNANYSYLYDPRNPVPTIGGTNLALPAGPYDQSSIENRSDILIFESSVLTQPYEVVGHMWAHLYVKSNCSNTDFTVKITDVYPDGRSILISDGIINAMRRNGFNATAPAMNSVEYAEVDIDLWSTAYQFNVGHKIRIAISSSNYPRFAANPNTGVPQTIYSYQYLKKSFANNTILIGPDYPSYIILPRPI
ncbi:MAG: CocE/NonD family hydrolase [Promethearchaeota archaeon]